MVGLAEKLYRHIFSNPKHFPAIYLFGTMLLQTNSAAEAEIALRCAESLNPRSPEVQNNLGLALLRQGKTVEAIACYDRALALKPNYPSAMLNKANALRLTGELAAALALYDALLALEASADAHFNRGVTLEALARPGDAVSAYRAALALKPDFGDALNNLGNALAAADQPAQALLVLDQAVAKSPTAPVLVNRAAALMRLRRFDAARADLDRALALNPQLCEAWCNRGNIAREAGEMDAALADYARALAIRPDDAQALWNRGMTRLLLGQWALGWADYELRHARTLKPTAALLPAPEWKGEEVAGRHILLYSEQGLGDAIQFCRFAGLLARRGARVTLLVPARLRALLDQLENVTVVDEVGQQDHFDLSAPLMSLPRYLDFTPSHLPAMTGPYLRPQPARIAHWAERLGSQGLRVGICWQGNPAGSIDSGRSVPLEKFAALAAVPGVRLVSLQKGAGLEQLARAAGRMRIEQFPDSDAGTDGFLDTSAIIAGLDLVVTSDTSVAHLAGAMGKPVWLALKLVPDWRWLLHRSDTPWYPSMRLYRQSALDDWDGPFAQMAADLAGRRRQA